MFFKIIFIMKKISRKNLSLDKEVIASLSESEMQSVVGGSKILPPSESMEVKGPSQLYTECGPNCGETSVEVRCEPVPWSMDPEICEAHELTESATCPLRPVTS